jgi:hypothetical protein
MDDHNKEIPNKTNLSNKNINDDISLLRSRDSIEDLLENFQSNKKQHLQSELLISRLIALSNKEENKEEYKEIFKEPPIRKRNRSRSTLIVRTTPSLINTSGSDVTTRSRSNSDYNIQNNVEKKNIFSFKSNNSKFDKCNTMIIEVYNKMKNYYKLESITPLELLNLKFHIRSNEPKIIKFYDKEPDDILLEKHQLAVFQEDNILYCKLHKLNKFSIIEYDIKSYNRFIETISCLPEKNNYCMSLENIIGDDFKCNDINKGDEILAAWDKEKLFNHITIHEYTIKENLVNKWPKIKNLDLVDKIKPRELLDKFWKSNVIEILSNEEYLCKIKKENIELLISSIIYILGEITNNEQIKYLKTILVNFYKKMIIIDPNNIIFQYECAKYSTFLELYVEAWDYIHKCDIILYSKKDDIIWLKQLKIYYLNYLMKKSPINDITTAQHYINIGHFTKKINYLEEVDDLVNTLEVVDHFLEGLIHLYYYNKDFINDEINEWSPDIIFILSCSSYCRSNIERNNEKCLLTISLISLELLEEKSYVCNEDCLLQVDKICIQHYTPINELSKNIIMLKINVLEKLFKISINLQNQKELSKNLSFKIFELLCQIENHIYIKGYYINYENTIVENIIKRYIINISITINLADILIERKYFSNVYLLILSYLVDKELWISSYNFMIKSSELIPNIYYLDKKELKNKIKPNYLNIQIYKSNLSDALLTVIDTICDDKECQFLINNWIEECFILNEQQYIYIKENKEAVQKLKTIYKYNDFEDLEKEEFICKLYEFFVVQKSNTVWLPEIYIDPTKFLKISFTPNNNLKKTNGTIIDEKMIKSIKKMISMGKSVDEIAFFYNISIVTINKILS